MRLFLTVIKNDYLRTMPRLASLLVITAIALASMLLAVHITDVQQVKAHVVLIAQSENMALPQSSKFLDIVMLNEKPPRSALAQQKYDAYITMDADGNMQIDTLRNEEFQNMLKMLLKNPRADIGNNQTERGVGVNILGFMMMFLLMIAFSNLFVFADDKEQGQLSRIAATPASFPGYLAAHCVYGLSLLLPEYLLLVFMKLFGWDIGLTLIQYAGLTFLLGFMGISFALLLNTFIKKPDNANMLGNAITVLTTVLAGSFYSFSRNNMVLDNIIKVLPQKQIMDFAQQLQNGSAAGHAGSIVYVLVLSLGMFACAGALLRRMYVKTV